MRVTIARIISLLEVICQAKLKGTKVSNVSKGSNVELNPFAPFVPFETFNTSKL